MEKKESLEPKELTPLQPEITTVKKVSWWQEKLFIFAKFVLGILLLPFVYAVTVSFWSNFSKVEDVFRIYFWWGVVGFVLTYFFIFEPSFMYQKGHKILNVLFRFFKPLLSVAPSLVPVYTLIIFVFYGFLSLFIKELWLLELTLFLVGFSLSLHLVFSAKSLRQRKDFLRATYLFGFSFVYIFNLNLLSIFLALSLKNFSFFDFLNQYYSIGSQIIIAIFRQLFVTK